MRCATAEGITWTFILITTDKKQRDKQWYITTITRILFLITSKWFCFTWEFQRLRKKVRFIFELTLHTLRINQAFTLAIQSIQMGIRMFVQSYDGITLSGLRGSRKWSGVVNRSLHPACSTRNASLSEKLPD
jgi:hypothetical protein